MDKPVLLSGIQPSGNLTLGNYLGALRQFQHFQTSHTTLYCIVNLHALTTRQDPETLKRSTLDALACYLACGIDPQKSILFVQSQVAEHAQLAWLLQCFTYFGELQRMTQFKEKSQRHSQNINAGLFGYPVLMAADILLYQTASVPVGDDQTQHLELARTIAERVNGLYGPVFTLPQRLTQKTGARVMSLLEPSKKMSKSCDLLNGVVLLLDSEAQIAEKFKGAVTDSDSPPRILHDRTNKPGVSNLIDIYAALTGHSYAACEQYFGGLKYAAFKKAIAEATWAELQPIQARFADYRKDETYLQAVLEQGAQAAKAMAQRTLQSFHEKLGL